MSTNDPTKDGTMNAPTATRPGHARDVASFKRTLRNAESAHARRTTLTGRNAPADPRHYFATLRAMMLTVDAVAEALDNDPRLAARYARAERRAAGLDT